MVQLLGCRVTPVTRVPGPTRRGRRRKAAALRVPAGRGGRREPQGSGWATAVLKSRPVSLWTMCQAQG